MKKNFFGLLLQLCGLGLMAQFAPPVGQPGTTAIHKDSSAITLWASGCIIKRGLQDISNSGGGLASVGDSSSAIGPSGTNGIVSLGDSGIAILTFDAPITNGTGPDFAIFENSFSDDFLEFAFVEVSSDGVNYVRFPATCNIQDTLQTDAFGLSDATLVNNLAGKYRANYGTPFDLQELSGQALLDINAITHVKIIDAIGSINAAYASYDINGRKINDPFPTPFPSSGFDLDAVAVLHSMVVGLDKYSSNTDFSLYPNPAKDELHISLTTLSKIKIIEINSGKICLEIDEHSSFVKLDISTLAAGVYVVECSSGNKKSNKKLIVQK